MGGRRGRASSTPRCRRPSAGALARRRAGRPVPAGDEADEPPVPPRAGPVHGRHGRRRVEPPTPVERMRVDVADPQITVEGTHGAAQVRQVGLPVRLPPPVRRRVADPADPAFLALLRAADDLGPATASGSRRADGGDLGLGEPPPGDVGKRGDRRQRARELLHRDEELPPDQPAWSRPREPREPDRIAGVPETGGRPAKWRVARPVLQSRRHRWGPAGGIATRRAGGT